MAQPAKNVAVKTEQEGESRAPARAGARALSPFSALRTEIDRLFDEFSRPMFRFPLGRRLFEPEPFWSSETAFGVAMPAVDVVEKDKEFQVKAELPGLKAADIEVVLSGDMLTIKGEKKEEVEETKKGYRLSERRFGAFERSFSLPPGIDASKIEAAFDDGVLTITLPKTAEAQKQEKKIQVKSK